MYNYKTERPKLFTDEGFTKIIETRDRIHHLVREAGCCTVEKARCSGDSWQALAVIDYLVERKEIGKIQHPSGSLYDILFLIS